MDFRKPRAISRAGPVIPAFERWESAGSVVEDQAQLHNGFEALASSQRKTLEIRLLTPALNGRRRQEDC